MNYEQTKDSSMIAGIRCDAENCVYNNGSSCCTAGSIQVNNCFDDSTRTKCETFREV